MRALAASLVLLSAVVVAPSVSWADKIEKVKTTGSTKLLSRPGERGKVLFTVGEGKGMTVIAKDGRWLKVRVSGRTGWVPRSKVEVSDEIVRNTRRRSFVDGRGTSRGFGGEEGPEDRVGADALGDGVEANTGGDDDDDDGGKPSKPSKPVKKSGGGDDDEGGDEGGGDEGGGGGDDDDDAVVVEEDGEPARATARVKAKTVALQEPAEDAEESFDATPKMTLYPTGNKKGKYTEVENDDGELGYVLSSSLDVEEPDLGGPKKRSIDARARIGVTLISQTSNPGGGKVSTSAATLALGGTLLYPYKKKFMIGGEATYDYAKAYPGVANPDGMGSTSIGLHNLRLRALGGYDMKKKSGMMLFGRLGLHYQSFQVSNVEDLTKNKPKLPSEIITSAALGVGISLPRLSQKIGIRGSLDLLPFGSVSQTKNLEDGASPSAFGALFEAGLVYRWRKEMDIIATYNLTYLSMSFGARVPTSQRPLPAGMGEISRGDQFHVFSVGVARGF